jgi:hypothetical protein
MGFFSRAGECVNLAMFMDRDLGDDVCRASEAVYAKMSGL